MTVKLDRIGIVMMSAVGDAVHVLPVINAIKRARPASHVTWILQPGPATLVRGHAAVDEILLFDRAKGTRAYLDLRRELATRPFDVALALQVYFKAGLVLAMTRATTKLAGQTTRDWSWGLRKSQCTSFAASISFCDRSSLGVSAKTSRPRPISEP